MEKNTSKVDKDGKVDNHSWSWYGRFVNLTKTESKGICKMTPESANIVV